MNCVRLVTRVSFRTFLGSALFLTSVATVLIYAQAPGSKKKIASETDLPRFSYRLTGSSLDLVHADDATFKPFLDKFAADLDSVLTGYDIEDKATLSDLLLKKETVEEVRGDLAAATTAIEQRRATIVKPAEMATFIWQEEPILSAWRESGSITGDSFQQAYARALASSLQTRSNPMLQEQVKQASYGCKIKLSSSIESALKNQDADTKKTGTLNFEQASLVVGVRWYNKIYEPLESTQCAIFEDHAATRSISKPDIWPAREVTLTQADKLTPVRIAIWDSGVDTSIFPDQLYTDPRPGKHSPHGLAFDTQGIQFAADLQPLTPEQEAFYPKHLALNQGFNDIRDGISSPEATAAQDFLNSTPTDKLAELHRTKTFLDQWSHGTHVAGIAVRGNPAARLVVIQFNDGLAYLPFAPTLEWANRFKQDFQEVGDYLREHDVRVVNMSWLDGVSEFEDWLAKTSPEKDPEIRKHTAQQIYSVWRDGIKGAIARAPNTLFFCAAGNANSDNGFNGEVPASLHLPNLITVGAVDQAGDETPFTSYGDTVVLDADGYQVLSYMPGGSKVKMSGTSMASPNVANLAAKLIALQPSLTPDQVVAIMKRTADTSIDGRLHLINPAAAVSMLRPRNVSTVPVPTPAHSLR